MEFDTGLFEYEVYCTLCGSDNIEISYDKENNCIVAKCECGSKDIISLE